MDVDPETEPLLVLPSVLVLVVELACGNTSVAFFTAAAAGMGSFSFSTLLKSTGLSGGSDTSCFIALVTT